jgi:uncharacterized protein YxeA
MKFDIMALFVIIYGILFLVGASQGAQLHSDAPTINVTAYANDNYINLTMNRTAYNKLETAYNQSGRMAKMVYLMDEFVRLTGYQVQAMGIEFGFENNWAGPMPYAVASLLFVLFWLLGNNFNVIVLVIALVVMAKDWLQEKLDRSRIHLSE